MSVKGLTSIFNVESTYDIALARFTSRGPVEAVEAMNG
jgi:hypothetical protein